MDSKGGIRMKQLLSFLLIPVLIFSASAQPEVIPPDYLITEITISCDQDSPARRQFTDQESMGIILQYLRGASLYGEADSNSVDKNAPLYTIALTHSTGRVTVYRQIAVDYLAKDSSPWYQIDPEQGGLLQSLYHDLPGTASI